MDEKDFDVSNDVSGVLIQYPATDGSISDYTVSFLFCPLLALACSLDASIPSTSFSARE